MKKEVPPPNRIPGRGRIYFELAQVLNLQPQLINVKSHIFLVSRQNLRRHDIVGCATVTNRF